MNLDKQAIEEIMKDLLSPSHALIYVLVALLHKLSEKEILSRDDMVDIFNGLEEIVVELEPQQKESAEAQITLAVVNRFRRILHLTEED